jgi:amino acid transporter
MGKIRLLEHGDEREEPSPMASAVVEERELLAAMRWYDGFVVALANPSFLLTALGGSVVSLGGWGAIFVWLISVLIGGLHNNLYAEVAAMFPKLSGGVAVYAHEAWKRYTSFVGPLAAVGYWLGWSVVLALNGVIVGSLLQSEFWSSATFGTTNKSLLLGIDFTSSPAVLVGAVAIFVIWLANVFGVRPAVWTGYVTGALLLIPLAVIIVVPYLTGDFHTSNLHNFINLGSSATGNTGIRLVIGWLYLMCWSSYGFECCASFAPEYHDPARDTARALRASALFSIFVYGLLPLGAVGTFGDGNITFGDDTHPNNTLTFYHDVFHTLVGGASSIMVLMLCAGIVLSMNTATMDGSRALYGISQDGMTIRWLGKLNRNNVPGNAMTLDAILNLLLLFLAVGAGLSGYLKILAVSNFGYVLAHVLAISGFLLLRRDRPGWPRPIRVGPVWTVVAVFCLIYDIILLVVGSVSGAITGYDKPGTYTSLYWALAVLAIAVLLYVYRTVVEDRKPLRFSLDAPAMPDEKDAATAVPS